VEGVTIGQVSISFVTNTATAQLNFVGVTYTGSATITRTSTNQDATLAISGTGTGVTSSTLKTSVSITGVIITIAVDANLIWEGVTMTGKSVEQSGSLTVQTSTSTIFGVDIKTIGLYISSTLIVDNDGSTLSTFTSLGSLSGSGTLAVTQTTLSLSSFSVLGALKIEIWDTNTLIMSDILMDAGGQITSPGSGTGTLQLASSVRTSLTGVTIGTVADPVAVSVTGTQVHWTGVTMTSGTIVGGAASATLSIDGATSTRLTGVTVGVPSATTPLTITITASVPLIIDSTTIIDTGLGEVGTGVVRVSGATSTLESLSATGLTYTIDDGATLALDGATLTGQVIQRTSSGVGTLSILGSAVSILSGVDVQTGIYTDVQSGSTLITRVNSGTPTQIGDQILGTGLLQVEGDLNLGTVVIPDGLTISIESGFTLTIQQVTMTGGTIKASGTGKLSVEGSTATPSLFNGVTVNQVPISFNTGSATPAARKLIFQGVTMTGPAAISRTSTSATNTATLSIEGTTPSTLKTGITINDVLIAIKDAANMLTFDGVSTTSGSISRIGTSDVTLTISGAASTLTNTPINAGVNVVIASGSSLIVAGTATIGSASLSGPGALQIQANTAVTSTTITDLNIQMLGAFTLTLTDVPMTGGSITSPGTGLLTLAGTTSLTNVILGPDAVDLAITGTAVSWNGVKMFGGTMTGGTLNLNTAGSELFGATVTSTSFLITNTALILDGTQITGGIISESGTSEILAKGSPSTLSQVTINGLTVNILVTSSSNVRLIFDQVTMNGQNIAKTGAGSGTATLAVQGSTTTTFNGVSVGTGVITYIESGSTLALATTASSFATGSAISGGGKLSVQVATTLTTVQISPAINIEIGAVTLTFINGVSMTGGYITGLVPSTSTLSVEGTASTLTAVSVSGLVINLNVGTAGSPVKVLTIKNGVTITGCTISKTGTGAGQAVLAIEGSATTTFDTTDVGGGVDITILSVTTSSTVVLRDFSMTASGSITQAAGSNTVPVLSVRGIVPSTLTGVLVSAVGTPVNIEIQAGAILETTASASVSSSTITGTGTLHVLGATSLTTVQALTGITIQFASATLTIDAFTMTGGKIAEDVGGVGVINVAGATSTFTTVTINQVSIAFVTTSARELIFNGVTMTGTAAITRTSTSATATLTVQGAASTIKTDVTITDIVVGFDSATSNVLFFEDVTMTKGSLTKVSGTPVLTIQGATSLATIFEGVSVGDVDLNIPSGSELILDNDATPTSTQFTANIQILGSGLLYVQAPTIFPTVTIPNGMTITIDSTTLTLATLIMTGGTIQKVGTGSLLVDGAVATPSVLQTLSINQVPISFVTGTVDQKLVFRGVTMTGPATITRTAAGRTATLSITGTELTTFDNVDIGGGITLSVLSNGATATTVALKGVDIIAPGTIVKEAGSTSDPVISIRGTTATTLTGITVGPSVDFDIQSGATLATYFDAGSSTATSISTSDISGSGTLSVQSQTSLTTVFVTGGLTINIADTTLTLNDFSMTGGSVNDVGATSAAKILLVTADSDFNSVAINSIQFDFQITTNGGADRQLLVFNTVVMTGGSLLKTGTGTDIPVLRISGGVTTFLPSVTVGVKIIIDPGASLSTSGVIITGVTIEGPGTLILSADTTFNGVTLGTATVPLSIGIDTTNSDVTVTFIQVTMNGGSISEVAGTHNAYLVVDGAGLTTNLNGVTLDNDVGTTIKGTAILSLNILSSTAPTITSGSTFQGPGVLLINTPVTFSSVTLTGGVQLQIQSTTLTVTNVQMTGGSVSMVGTSATLAFATTRSGFTDVTFNNVDLDLRVTTNSGTPAYLVDFDGVTFNGGSVYRTLVGGTASDQGGLTLLNNPSKFTSTDINANVVLAMSIPSSAGGPIQLLTFDGVTLAGTVTKIGTGTNKALLLITGTTTLIGENALIDIGVNIAIQVDSSLGPVVDILTFKASTMKSGSITKVGSGSDLAALSIEPGTSVVTSTFEGTTIGPNVNVNLKVTTSSGTPQNLMTLKGATITSSTILEAGTGTDAGRITVQAPVISTLSSVNLGPNVNLVLETTNAVPTSPQDVLNMKGVDMQAGTITKIGASSPARFTVQGPSATYFHALVSIGPDVHINMEVTSSNGSPVNLLIFDQVTLDGGSIKRSGSGTDSALLLVQGTSPSTLKDGTVVGPNVNIAIRVDSVSGIPVDILTIKAVTINGGTITRTGTGTDLAVLSVAPGTSVSASTLVGTSVGPNVNFVLKVSTSSGSPQSLLILQGASITGGAISQGGTGTDVALLTVQGASVSTLDTVTIGPKVNVALVTTTTSGSPQNLLNLKTVTMNGGTISKSGATDQALFTAYGPTVTTLDQVTLDSNVNVAMYVTTSIESPSNILLFKGVLVKGGDISKATTSSGTDVALLIIQEGAPTLATTIQEGSIVGPNVNIAIKVTTTNTNLLIFNAAEMSGGTITKLGSGAPTAVLTITGNTASILRDSVTVGPNVNILLDVTSSLGSTVYILTTRGLTKLGGTITKSATGTDPAGVRIEGPLVTTLDTATVGPNVQLLLVTTTTSGNAQKLLVMKGSTMNGGTVTKTGTSDPALISIEGTALSAFQQGPVTIGPNVHIDIPISAATDTNLLSFDGVTMVGGTIKNSGTGGGSAIVSILGSSTSTFQGVVVATNVDLRVSSTATLQVALNGATPTTVASGVTIDGSGILQVQNDLTLTSATISATRINLVGTRTLTFTGVSMTLGQINEVVGGTATLSLTGAGSTLAGVTVSNVDFIIASGTVLTLTNSGTTATYISGGTMKGLGSITVTGTTILNAMIIGNAAVSITIDSTSSNVKLSLQGVTMTDGQIIRLASATNSAILSIEQSLTSLAGVLLQDLDILIATPATLETKNGAALSRIVRGTVTGPGILSVFAGSTLQIIGVKISTTDINLAAGSHLTFLTTASTVTGGTIDGPGLIAAQIDVTFSGVVLTDVGVEITSTTVTMIGVTMTRGFVGKVSGTADLVISGGITTMYGVEIGAQTGYTEVAVTIAKGATLRLSNDATDASDISGGTINGPGTLNAIGATTLTNLFIGDVTDTAIVVDGPVLTIDNIEMLGGTLNSGTTAGEVIIISSCTFVEVDIGALSPIIMSLQIPTGGVNVRLSFIDVSMTGGQIRRTGTGALTLLSELSIEDFGTTTTLFGVAVGDNIHILIDFGATLVSDDNAGNPSTFSSIGPITINGPGTFYVKFATSLTNVLIGDITATTVVVDAVILTLNKVTMTGGLIRSTGTGSPEVKIQGIAVTTTFIDVVVGTSSGPVPLTIDVQAAATGTVTLEFQRVIMLGGSIKKGGTGTATAALVINSGQSFLEGVTIGTPGVAATITSGSTLTVLDNGSTKTTMTGGTITGVGTGALTVVDTSTFEIKDVTSVATLNIDIEEGSVFSILASTGAVATSISGGTIDGPGTLLIASLATTITDESIGVNAPVKITLNAAVAIPLTFTGTNTIKGGVISKIGTSVVTLQVHSTSLTLNGVTVTLTATDIILVTGTLRVGADGSTPSSITVGTINGAGPIHIIGDAIFNSISIGTTTASAISFQTNAQLTFNGVQMKGATITRNAATTTLAGSILSIDTTESILSGVAITDITIRIRWFGTLTLKDNAGAPSSVTGGTVDGPGKLKIAFATTFTTVTIGATSPVVVIINDNIVFTMSGGSFAGTMQSQGANLLTPGTFAVLNTVTLGTSTFGNPPVIISVTGTLNVVAGSTVTVTGGQITGVGSIVVAGSLTLTDVAVGTSTTPFGTFSAVGGTIVIGGSTPNTFLTALSLTANSQVTITEPTAVSVVTLTVDASHLTVTAPSLDISTFNWQRSVDTTPSIIDGDTTINVSTLFHIFNNAGFSGPNYLRVPLNLLADTSYMRVDDAQQLFIESTLTVGGNVGVEFYVPQGIALPLMIQTTNGGVWDVTGQLRAEFGTPTDPPTENLYLGDVILRTGGSINGINGALSFNSIKVYVGTTRTYYSSCCQIVGYVFPLQNFDGLLVESGEYVTIDPASASSQVQKEIRILSDATVEVTAGTLSTETMTIDSGSLTGAGNVEVTVAFYWLHALRPFADSEVSGLGTLTIKSGANAYLYLDVEGGGTGATILGKTMIIESGATLNVYTNGPATNLVGQGEIINNGDLIIHERPLTLPTFSGSSTGTCYLPCVFSKKRELPDRSAYLELPDAGTESRKRAAPVGWTCNPALYDTATQNPTAPLTCDCNCGVVDPDCFVDPTPPIFGCGYGEICSVDGLCIAVANVPITWINHATFTTLASTQATVTFGTLVNENGGILNVVARPIQVDTRFVWNNLGTTPFLVCQDIGIHGTVQYFAATAAPSSVALTLRSDCTFAPGAVLTVDYVDWAPTASSKITAGTIVVTNTFQVGLTEPSGTFAFASDALITINAAATLRVNVPGAVTGAGSWLNNGAIITAMSAPTNVMNLGTLVTQLSTTDALAGIITAINGAIETNSLRVDVNSVAALTTLVTGNQHISGSFILTDWASIILTGGTYALVPPTSVTFTSLTLLSGASLTATGGTASAPTFAIQDSTLDGTTTWGTTTMSWSASSTLTSYILAGGAITVSGASATLTLGVSGAPAGTLILQRSINIDSPTTVSVYPILMQLQASGVMTLATGTTMNIYDPAAANTFVSTDVTGYIDNSGSIVLQDAARTVDMGKLLLRWSGSLDTGAGSMQMTDLDMFTASNGLLFNGDASGVQVVSGTVSGATIGSLTLMGGTGSNILDTTQTIMVTNTLLVRDGATLTLSGSTGSFTINTFRMETGLINGDGSFTITGSGVWQRQSDGASSIDGTGDVILAPGATLLIESLDPLETQELADGRTLVVQDTAVLTFAAKWFSTPDQDSMFIEIRRGGTLDISSVERNNIVESIILNEGTISGPQNPLVRFTMADLTMQNAGTTYSALLNIGTLTIVYIDKLVVMYDSTQEMFSHSTSTFVTLIGDLTGTTFTSLILEGLDDIVTDAGIATFSPTTTPNNPPLTVTIGSLQVLNGYTLNIGNLPMDISTVQFDSATLVNLGQLTIDTLFNWKTFSQSSSITGALESSAIIILSGAEMTVSGSVALNMALHDHTITNYGTITFSDTDNVNNRFPFGERLINHGTMDLRISSSVDFGEFDNYGTATLTTQPWEINYSVWRNFDGSTWTSTGYGRTIATQTFILEELAVISSQSTIDSDTNAVLVGTLNAAQATFEGTTTMDKRYVSGAKTSFAGDLYITSERALGLSKCVTFRDVNLYVEVVQAVRESSFTTINIGAESICKTYGEITTTQVSSVPPGVFDLCEVPTLASEFNNGLLYVVLSIEIACPPRTYTCGDPYSVCPVGCVPGTVCTTMNECLSSPIPVCSVHATCTDLPTRYTCTCSPGWTGDGQICDDVNECLDEPCTVEGQVCQNTRGGYTCSSCPSGFTNVGINCVDIDECASGTLCVDDPKRPCVNVPGSYYCKACPVGYFADTPTSCIDIDECANQIDQCKVGTCSNTPGGYKCGDCPPGYEYPSDQATTCADINECAAESDSCSPLRECHNTLGSYTCGDCPRGYVNDGELGCYDVNECYLDESLNGPCIGRTCTLDDSGWFYCGDCSISPPQYFDSLTTCAERLVTPFTECRDTKDGLTIVYFGYTSTFEEEEYIGPEENFFSDATKQPLWFMPGHNRFQVALVEDTTPVSWTIRGQTATADSNVPDCPVDAPTFESNEFSFKELDIIDWKVGVVLVNSVFNQDLLSTESPCEGTDSELELQDCLTGDPTCVGSNVQTLFASSTLRGEILNYKECKTINIEVTTSAETSSSLRDASGTMHFKAGRYERDFELNTEPSLKSQILTLCCSDISRNTPEAWYGDFSLEFTLSSLPITVSVLRDSVLRVDQHFSSIVPSMTCGDIRGICKPFARETVIPEGSCRYINFPSTTSPVGDYLRLASRRSYVDTLPMYSDRVSVGIVVWWRSASQIANVYYDRNMFLNNSNCAIHYALGNSGLASTTVKRQDTRILLAEASVGVKQGLNCSYPEFSQLQSSFQATIERLAEGVNVNSLTQEAISYAMSDEWQDCLEWADQLITPYDSDASLSSRCHYEVDSPEYLSDPCCNDNLDQCCAGTALKKTAYEIAVFDSCMLPYCSNQTATSYSSIRESTTDDRLNCEATTREIIKGKGFNPLFSLCLYYTYGQTCSPYEDQPQDAITKYYDSGNSCSADVHPQSFCGVDGLCTAPCEGPEDCTSGICVDYGTYKSCAFVPEEDVDGQEKLVQCLKTQTNVFLLLFMQENLGATDSAEFDQMLFDAVTGGTCSGAPLPEDESITDEATCKQKQYCNWAVCAIDELYCKTEDCNDYDHMGSDNYCALCLETAGGPACPEVSRFGTCVITEQDYVTYTGLCDYYGYSYNALSPTPCVDANAANKAECNPPEYCQSQDECEGACIYPHLNEADTCRSITVNGLFLTWREWIDGNGNTYGLCVLDGADALSCPRNFGLWKPGTKWEEALYHTQALCEANGRCSDLTITNEADCTTAGFCDVCPSCTTPQQCSDTGLCNNHHGCIRSTFDENGRCLDSSWTPLGCLFTEIQNPFACFSLGADYTWVERFTSETDCEQIFLCRTTSVPDFDVTSINSDLLGLTDIPLGWNNKSQDSCTACDEQWLSVYEFQTGVWSPRVWEGFTWAPRRIFNYQWINTFQQAAFEDLVSVSQDQYLGTIRTTELLCKHGEEKELVSRLSCDCASQTGLWFFFSALPSTASCSLLPSPFSILPSPLSPLPSPSSLLPPHLTLPRLLLPPRPNPNHQHRSLPPLREHRQRVHLHRRHPHQRRGVCRGGRSSVRLGEDGARSLLPV
jgi:hypothetical protein